MGKGEIRQFDQQTDLQADTLFIVHNNCNCTWVYFLQVEGARVGGKHRLHVCCGGGASDYLMIPTFQLILYRLISHGPSSQQQVVGEVGTLRNNKCGRRWRSAQLNTTNQTFVCTVQAGGLGWVTPWLQSIAHSEQRSKDFICDCPYDNWQCKTSCNIWNLTQNCNVCSGTRGKHRITNHWVGAT